MIKEKFRTTTQVTKMKQVCGFQVPPMVKFFMIKLEIWSLIFAFSKNLLVS